MLAPKFIERPGLRSQLAGISTDCRTVDRWRKYVVLVGLPSGYSQIERHTVPSCPISLLDVECFGDSRLRLYWILRLLQMQIRTVKIQPIHASDIVCDEVVSLFNRVGVFYSFCQVDHVRAAGIVEVSCHIEDIIVVASL